MNTQCSTQWDGFRHFSHVATGTFYNGTTASDIQGPSSNHKCSIHHWAEHGISGRGILLDYRTYATSKGLKYDAFATHEIAYSELEACGKAQGIDIRPAAQGGDVKVGDMLFIRSGFTEDYHSASPSAAKAAALRGYPQNGGNPHQGQAWAGVKQEDAMLDWLHDCYFATVAGDAPSFEAWPSKAGYYLHEYLLARWGVPLGELWDLERLAKRCGEEGRWTFFVTSSVANVTDGIASPPNAIAFL
jgi:hypothetical protein